MVILHKYVLYSWLLLTLLLIAIPKGLGNKRQVKNLNKIQWQLLSLDRQTLTETTVIFSWLMYVVLEVEFIITREMLIVGTKWSKAWDYNFQLFVHQSTEGESGFCQTKFCGFLYYYCYYYYYYYYYYRYRYCYYCCCCYNFFFFVLIIWKRVPIVWNSVVNSSLFVWRKVLEHMAHPFSKFKGVQPPTPYREEKVLPPDPNILSDL